MALQQACKLQLQQAGQQLRNSKIKACGQRIDTYRIVCDVAQDVGADLIQSIERGLVLRDSSAARLFPCQQAPCLGKDIRDFLYQHGTLP